MTGEAARRVFSFGPFEVYEAAEELRKHGVRIKLHAQPFQVLLMLLERPSDVVTREEMRVRLWGADTFVDFDHGLNSAVNKIREALTDSAAQPRYVETVAGKGYRFIAPVTRVPPAVSAPADELPTPPRTVVSILLLLMQVMYLSFYLTALANLGRVDELFVEAKLFPPVLLTGILVVTAAVLIPVRFYIGAAAALNLRQLPAKFRRLFPALLPLDLLWALSPFLLTHYVSAGLALGLSAILVYAPFAQRSLVLMYGRQWITSASAPGSR